MSEVTHDEMLQGYRVGEVTKIELMQFGLRRIVRSGTFEEVDEACEDIFYNAPDTWKGVLKRLPAMLANESPSLDAWRDVEGFHDWMSQNPDWPDRIRAAIHLPVFPELMQAMAADIRSHCEARRRPH